MLALTVLHAFGDYAIGETITDPAAIEAIQGTANAHHVVRTNVPDPEPEASAQAEVASEPAKAEPESDPDTKTDTKLVGKRG